MCGYKESLFRNQSAARLRIQLQGEQQGDEGEGVTHGGAMRK